MRTNPTTASTRRRSWIHALLLIAAAGLVVLVLALIAISSLPMRGAGAFGALAKKIKGNPGATATISFIAAAALWLGVGLLAAFQEWAARKRSRV